MAEAAMTTGGNLGFSVLTKDICTSWSQPQDEYRQQLEKWTLIINFNLR